MKIIWMRIIVKFQRIKRKKAVKLETNHKENRIKILIKIHQIKKIIKKCMQNIL